MSAADQHDRTKFLGGSDAAVVFGVSPYKTPIELWQEKRGVVVEETPDAAQRKRFARGHKLEPFIRDMVIDRLIEQGLTVEVLAINKRYQDTEHPFLACEIDFELLVTGSITVGESVFNLKNEHINADAKSVSGFARKKWGEADTEDVPIEYAAQFMHGLMVTGRRICLVAALRSFDDVDIFWTLRDDETIAAMREKEVSFWLDCVIGGQRPDVFKYSDMAALFPLDNGQAIVATPDIEAKVNAMKAVTAQIKTLKEREESLKLDIVEFISPNARLTDAQGKDIASWKGQSAARLDATAIKEQAPDVYAKFLKFGTSRVLRFPVIKKGS